MVKFFLFLYMALDVSTVWSWIGLLVSILASPLMVLMVVFIHPRMEALGLKLTAFSGYNSMQILWRPYLLLCLVLGICWQVAIYGILAIGKDIGFEAFIASQETCILTWLVYAISLWCLYMFSKPEGIEGNVIGFIFSPILLVCSTYQVIHHFVWVYHQI